MRHYHVWSEAEQQALRLGVAKHGCGAWEMIRTDPEFQKQLYVPAAVQYILSNSVVVFFNHPQNSMFSVCVSAN
jgi:hypothetical protein